MTKVVALLRKDARGIYRDRFLLTMLGYPLLLALAVRLAVPWLPVAHLDLYLAPAVVLFASSIFGLLFGFSLIEEREQRTWLLLRVLPLEERTLFGYLTVTTAGLAFAAALAAALVYGRPAADLCALVALTASAALTAPLQMLLLGVAAANKIEGLAFGKILSAATAVPGLAFVLPGPWQWLLAWSPFYWLYLGLLRAYAGDAALGRLAVLWPGWPAWCFVTLPTLLSLAGIVVFVRMLRRRVV